MVQTNDLKDQGTNRDKDIREMQDEALETPGYSDDPHIGSSNRPADYTADETSEDGGKSSEGGQ